MGGGHQHASAGMRSRGRLLIALGIGVSVVAVQLLGAVLSDSLALLADAAHMFTDVAGIALAILAISLAARATAPRRTFGLYRLEILAAVANGLLLLALSAYILVEAVQRWQQPVAVQPGIMIAAAVYGVLANGTSMYLLRHGSRASLAVRGAYLEVLSDALGSIGVAIAGVVVWTTGYARADVIVSVLIALFMIPRTLLLLRDAFGVLMENAPRGIDLDRLRADILAVPGVVAVHDLHVWTITSGMPSLSAHVAASGDPYSDGSGTRVLCDVQAVVHDRHGIEHCTLQIEAPDHVVGEESAHP